MLKTRAGLHSKQGAEHKQTESSTRTPSLLLSVICLSMQHTRRLLAAHIPLIILEIIPPNKRNCIVHRNSRNSGFSFNAEPYSFFAAVVVAAAGSVVVGYDYNTDFALAMVFQTHYEKSSVVEETNMRSLGPPLDLSSSPLPDESKRRCRRC